MINTYYNKNVIIHKGNPIAKCTIKTFIFIFIVCY